MPEKPVNKTAKRPPAKSVAPLDPAIAERRRFPRPLPLPEVKEGNGDDSEWAMWLEHAEQQAPIDDSLGSPELKNTDPPG